MAVRSPWSAGLGLVPGSVRLILSRWALWLAAGLPGIVAGAQAIGEAGGREPFFTHAPRPFPLAEQVTWLGRLPGGMWGGLGVGLVLGWVGGLLLTAGAVRVLDPRRAERPRVWRAVFDEGARAWFPYLRVAALALCGIVLGTRALGLGFERLQDHAKVAGWTGRSVVFVLPLSRLTLTVLWVTLVGTWAFWCNVLVVADRRRHVRRLLTVVPRLCARHPLRALLPHVVVSLASLSLGAVVLVAWRQSGHVDPAPWIAAWGAALLVQSWIWHWRLRACRLIWEAADVADLRRLPDVPWHVFRRLGGSIRRRLSQRAPPPLFFSQLAVEPESPEPGR